MDEALLLLASALESGSMSQMAFLRSTKQILTFTGEKENHSISNLPKPQVWVDIENRKSFRCHR
jgi:hypothetical protein